MWYYKENWLVNHVVPKEQVMDKAMEQRDTRRTARRTARAGTAEKRKGIPRLYRVLRL